MGKALKIIGLNLFLLFGIVQIEGNIIYKNPSISEPIGYYLALPGLPIAKGDLVLTCITNRSYTHVFTELGMKEVSGELL
jgi:type IV secretory pathway protease TraF